MVVPQSAAEFAPAAGAESAVLPWPAGAATGVGSMPGVDPDEAMRVVVGELAAFPHLVELPNAGAAAGLIGRGIAHLTGMHVELATSGWRFAAHAGTDERRARAALTRDLDVLEEHTQGYTGPLKIACAGPLTLAGSVELHYGDKALADAGAVRDIAASLAEGVAEVAAEVARRVPGARLVVQLDEPLLPAALAGTMPTASGFGMLPLVEPADATSLLRSVVDAVAAGGWTPIAHCCAASPPIGVLVDAGVRAVSLDATLLSALAIQDEEAVGTAVEAGVVLFLGLVPSVEPTPMPSTSELAAPARRLWSRLGFAPELLTRRTVVTPTCGLAGASPSWARRALAESVRLARVLAEEPEEH
jgi:methionine synthase II (cobalamin-independent)